MPKCLRKFFGSSKTTVVLPILLIISLIAYFIVVIFSDYSFYYVPIKILGVALCILGLISYKKHQKNLMALAISSILAMITYYQIQDIPKYTYYIYYPDQLDTLSTIDFIVDIVITVLLITMFINHIAINKTHEPQPKKIALNEILIIIIILLNIFTLIKIIVTVQNEVMNLTDYHIYVIDCLYSIFALGFVLSIETHVDEYKRIRDKIETDGSWNDVTKAAIKGKVFK